LAKEAEKEQEAKNRKESRLAVKLVGTHLLVSETDDPEW